MTLLPTLILAHLIADFPLQTDTVFRFKNSSSYGIALHVLIHLITTLCLIEANLSAVVMLLTIGVLHFACDWYKVRYTEQNSLPSFVIDQLFHMLVLVLCASYFLDVRPIFHNLLILPIIAYAIIPTATVFFFVLGHDISRYRVSLPKPILWAMGSGLNVSHYFSLPFLAFLLYGVFYR